MTNTQIPEYTLVVGHGRSGTNMVLDMLDCHTNTFCRNEPNELVGTAFRDLGDGMFLESQPADFETQWARAVAQTSVSCGHRDRPMVNKTYLRQFPGTGVAQYMMNRPKFRWFFMPRQGGKPVEQWNAPRFYMDRTQLSQALPVFKVLLCPAWAIKAHKICPGQRIVHVIRQPQDFIQSWWSRYVRRMDLPPEQVFMDNLPSVTRIQAHFGRANEGTQDYSMKNLLISELWRWRYVNEVMVQHLGGSDRYLQVGYESAMADQPAWAEKVFAFAGLEMTETSRQAVAGMRNILFKERQPDGLDPALVEEAVHHILSDSILRDQLPQGGAQT